MNRAGTAFWPTERSRFPKRRLPMWSLRQAKVLGRAEREHRFAKRWTPRPAHPGARWREDKALLDTVVNLTEFPSAILGNFDPQFLELPEEVLVTVMRDHQKYFAVEDADGKLAAAFSGGAEYGRRSRRHRSGTATSACCGRASTMRAFSGRRIRNIRCANALECLKHVTFQKDLGSYYDKTHARAAAVPAGCAEIIKQSGMAVRPGVVHKAACLAKTDLTTELVKEFTELQGIVGGLYARVQAAGSEHMPEARRQAIADAIYDQYKPESMEDPCRVRGRRGALDRRQGRQHCRNVRAGTGPSGSKDPFALRRQANGIVRDHCRAQAADTVQSIDCGRARRLPGLGGGEEVRRQTSILMKPLQRSSASVWSSICATRGISPTTW